jgi:TetR/AcrR family transcriptional regulator, cholesterol catabolism regulator
MKADEEKIMEVAYRLFKQRGIRSTNLQHVARGCNSSLWDINLIVKSRKDLVLAVVKHTLNKKTTYLVINSALCPSAVTELNNFFKFVDDTIADLGPEILTELRRYNPLALDQIRDLVDHKLIPCLQRNIDRGLTEGFFRNELDSGLYASAYFYILRTVLESERDWFETKKAIAHINDIFLHGVLNIKGMRI